MDWSKEKFEQVVAPAIQQLKSVGFSREKYAVIPGQIYNELTFPLESKWFPSQPSRATTSWSARRNLHGTKWRILFHRKTERQTLFSRTLSGCRVRRLLTSALFERFRKPISSSARLNVQLCLSNMQR